MGAERQALSGFFNTLAACRDALREAVGPEQAAARFALVRELVARLSHKSLLAASKREIQSAGRTMIGEGRDREAMRTLQTALVDFYDRACAAGVVARHPIRDPEEGPGSSSSVPEVALVVGLPGGVVTAVAELLEPAAIAVRVDSSHQSALEAMGWFPFRVIVCSLPPVAPIGFFDAIRAPGSLCRSAGVIVVVRDGQADQAVSFVGRGANRVIAVSDLAGGLPAAVAELGVVSERVRVRVPVEVYREGKGEPEPCHSENISSTGILLRTRIELLVGEEVDLRLTAPGDDLPIQVRAQVVRHTSFGREDFSGFGLRFLSFVGEGQHRLGLFLGRRMA